MFFWHTMFELLEKIKSITFGFLAKMYFLIVLFTQKVFHSFLINRLYIVDTLGIFSEFQPLSAFPFWLLLPLHH